MSIVLYAFKARSDENLNEQIGIMKQLIASSKFLQLFQFEGVELQMFKTYVGIVFRVLEDGYGLKNKMWADEYKQFFPQCNYDDRSDMSESEKQNEKIALFVDAQVKKGEYSILSIVSPNKPN